MVTNINISVLEGNEYMVSAPAGATVRYNNEIVTSTFIAIAGVNQLTITSDSTLSGQVTLTRIFRSYYEAYDCQGGVWAYQPVLDKWTSQYSFRPEWMTMVGNRLVTFKDGKPYIHNNSVDMNTFYAQAYDSVLTFAHNEAGNTTKVYQSVSVEGDAPDLIHVRTEVPNVQSSDIRTTDYSTKEGVKYSTIYRDRLSPNETGSPEQKMYKGDVMRGEIGKFQVNYILPVYKKNLKLFNIGFNMSRGHNTIPENGG